MEQKSGSYKMDCVCICVLFTYIFYFLLKDSLSSVVLYNF